MFTCEHASNRYCFLLNFEFSFSYEDSIYPPYESLSRMKSLHWGYDIGAYDAMVSLANYMEAPWIASQFSRLIIDANRSLDSDTLIRQEADGEMLNMNLKPSDRDFRIDNFWKPYRSMLSNMISDYPSLEYLISIHSFTPVYQGKERKCEIGILYLENDEKFAMDVSMIIA